MKVREMLEVILDLVDVISVSLVVVSRISSKSSFSSCDRL